MSNPMKIRAVAQDGMTEVRVLVSHDMETGQRKDEAGMTVPAWYVTDLVVTHNGRVVLQGAFGTAVSKNPYLSFRFRGGAPGDTVAIRWQDTRGDSRSDETKIV